MGEPMPSGQAGRVISAWLERAWFCWDLCGDHAVAVLYIKTWSAQGRQLHDSHFSTPTDLSCYRLVVSRIEIFEFEAHTIVHDER